MRHPEQTRSPGSDWRYALPLALVFLALLGAMAGRALSRPLSHDEHQYVAAAALVAREGLRG